MSAVIQLRASQSEKPTVSGGRAKNDAYRSREYLTEAEIEQLLEAAGKSRNPTRDRLLILLAFRHALRVSELVDVKVEQIDLITDQDEVVAGGEQGGAARPRHTPEAWGDIGCAGSAISQINRQLVGTPSNTFNPTFGGQNDTYITPRNVASGLSFRGLSISIDRAYAPHMLA